ncbi:MAG: [FeFe] hydrogenase H-cluster radical SAM maturase HydG [Candidatus Omnitrophota bacterium]
MKNTIINEKYIFNILQKTQSPGAEKIKDILRKAEQKKGLSLSDVGYLVNLNDRALLDRLFAVAGKIKKEIYGERLVFFAPLYVSDFCVNDCDYCNFHKRNTFLKRTKLSIKGVKEQVKFLVNSGHKRILVEFGEDPLYNDIGYVTEVIKAIYSVKISKGNIRRVNVNIAATTIENYRKLKQAKIGTYQLFQETYHRQTYKKFHHGPKQDYQRQITAHNRVFQAGIDDVGLGVLFGLYDWRFEVLSLLMHAQYLDKKYGVGPHTISVPRIQDAPTVKMDLAHKVSDDDFLKIIAILRLAIPYAGMIISTREGCRIRKKAFKIGISQASASSCTSVGGYGRKINHPQFAIHDERSLEEVIRDVVQDGLLPSFCTACYRLGRTGEDFMDIAKPGHIHNFCRSNGLLTFAEYLEDFSHNRLYVKGQGLIRFYLGKIKDKDLREDTRRKLQEIKQGSRDLYF